MPVQKVIYQCIKGLGSTYAADQVGRYLGKQFAIIDDYRSSFCGNAKDMYSSGCQRVSSTAKLFAVGGSCTIVAYSLAAFRVIPIRSSEVWTLAKLTVITWLFFKVYCFFSKEIPQKKVTEVIDSAIVEKKEVKRVSLDQTLVQYVEQRFEVLSEQIYKTSEGIDSSLVIAPKPDTVIQLVQVKIPQLPFHLEGFLLSRNSQKLAVFPLTINQIPSLISVGLRRGMITKVEFWQMKDTEDSACVVIESSVEKPLIDYDRMPKLASHTKPKIASSKATSGDVLQHMDNGFDDLSRLVSAQSKQKTEWLQKIRQRITQRTA